MSNKTSAFVAQLENPLPSFQQRVSECMIMLGSLDLKQYFGIIEQTFSEETLVLGDEVYNSHIRPICVYKQLIWNEVVQVSDIKDKNVDRFADWIKNKIALAEFRQQQEQNEQQKKKMNQKSCLEIYQNYIQRSKKIPLDEQANSKKKPKKGSKADQQYSKQRKTAIKESAANNKFFSDLDFVFANFHPHILRTQFGMSNKIAEIKLITFFYIRDFIDYNFKREKILQQQVYQCIHVLKRVILLIDKFQGPKYNLIGQPSHNKNNIEISPTLISDLKLTFLYLVNKFKYKNQKILVNFPRLAYDNKHYKFFSSLHIKAYPSQIQLIQYLRSSFNEDGRISVPKLIGYNTMVGSGKTSIIVALATFINKMNSKKIVTNQKNRTKLIFSCQIASVRAQVARLLYKNHIKFSIACKKIIKRKNSQYIFPYLEKIGDLTSKSDEIDVIISDWQTLYLILDRHQYSQQQLQVLQSQQLNWKNSQKFQIAKVQKQKSIVFVDEPSYACNSGKAEQTLKLLTIFKNRAPKVTILSSATFPSINELPNVRKLVSSQYPNLQCEQIQSKQFQIGCQFCTFKGEVLYPHTGVKNKQQILAVIQKMQENPFIMRLYTGTGLLLLLNQCKKNKIRIKANLDLKSYKTTITYKDFPQIAKQILIQISQLDDKLVQQVCKLSQDSYQTNNSQNSEDQQDFFQNKENLSYQKKNENYIDFSRIITVDAYKFLGGCLIATQDPVNFALKYFSFWIDDIPNIKKLKKIYQEGNYDLEEINFILGDLQQYGVASKKIQPSSNQNSIPAKKVINSIKHFENYFRSFGHISKHQLKIYQSKVLNPTSFKQIINFFEDVHIDDSIVKLLLCGIGIYAQHGLPSQYLAKVQQMASINQLAFIISDRSLSCGVNFPIANVILLDDLASNLELNQIFQLVGRAGRVGRSWAARAYIQKSTSQRLFQYIQGYDNRTGRQIEVFEELAEHCFMSQQLKLRTINSQIIESQNSENLGLNSEKKLAIRIKQKENSFVFRHQIKRISIIMSYDNKLLSAALPFKIYLGQGKEHSLSYYKVPTSFLTIIDLPKRANEFNHLQQNIDFERYYKNEQQFIRKIILNATIRIGKDQCGLNIEERGILNQFSYCDYEKYYCSQTATFAVIVEYPNVLQPELQSCLKYKLNQIRVIESFERLLPSSSRQLLEFIQFECKNIVKKMVVSPISILFSDVKQIKNAIKVMNQKEEFIFYRDLFNCFKVQVEDIYDKITGDIDNKNSLLYQEQIKMVIFYEACIKFTLFRNQLFCIDQDIRDVSEVRKIIEAIYSQEHIEIKLQVQGPQEIEIIEIQPLSQQNL